MFYFSRSDRHEAIFSQMLETGESTTMMYLYGNEIKKFLKRGLQVTPIIAHSTKRNLFLCQVTLSKKV